MNKDRTSVERFNARVAFYRRALVKGWGRKPNALESSAIARAASLSARSEAAQRNPNVTENDIVRLDRLANMARRDLARIKEAGRAKEQPMTLADAVRSIRGEAHSG